MSSIEQHVQNLIARAIKKEREFHQEVNGGLSRDIQELRDNHHKQIKWLRELVSVALSQKSSQIKDVLLQRIEAELYNVDT
jgi:hypothetical protein